MCSTCQYKVGSALGQGPSALWMFDVLKDFPKNEFKASGWRVEPNFQSSILHSSFTGDKMKQKQKSGTKLHTHDDWCIALGRKKNVR